MNKENLGSIYDDYLIDTKFDNSKINTIYQTKINNKFNYRGITIKIKDDFGNVFYIQLLANVDGEVTTIKNLLKTLLWGNMIVATVSIFASYVISKKTLDSLYESYNKQTEFVQNVAHELRTPLTIIQAKQQLLLEEPDSKILDKSEDINISIKETRRLTKMIKELMLLATSDMNEIKVEKEETDIDEMIREIIGPYAECAKLENKELVTELEYNKKINIDINKISQVIIILLDNAIKYTKPGDTITIKTTNRDNKCIIEVIDTGIGISKEGLKHVFERFYREDKARSRETGGTGLGLSIAYTLIKIHGGNIKIMQENPKGTRVIVKI